MKLAFCLFKYFPYGGLQRDFLRIARECLRRGHTIDVYTMRWEGGVEPGLTVHVLPVRGWQNHTRIRSYLTLLREQLTSENYDLVVGFNKMPFLDVYYTADVCYQARIYAQRGLLHRYLPRYKQLIELERAVFANGNTSRILLISPKQQAEYTEHYHTEAERFHLLPPGIERDRVAPPNAQAIRQTMRQSFQIPANHFLLLMVGSGFKTKGVDRAIKAFAVLPGALKARCHLFVIGQDDPKLYQRLAAIYGLTNKVRFLGGRDDVPHFMLAADVLLHPARHENTGTVLLEAIASGLPVLTVDVCGYAHYVTTAKAGKVIQSPFYQTLFNQALSDMLYSSQRETWRQNAIHFAKNHDIYSMPQKAADMIEQAGQA
jgi:UDP-glucose:(heptosyl)LPS alpha-1,3-glucosyltransferase